MSESTTLIIKDGRRAKAITPLTPELTARVAGMLAERKFPSVVAAKCNIPISTYWMWLRRGYKAIEDGVDCIEADFANAVDAAEAESVDTFSTDIYKAAKSTDNAKALMDFASMRHRKLFRPADKNINMNNTTLSNNDVQVLGTIVARYVTDVRTLELIERDFTAYLAKPQAQLSSGEGVEYGDEAD